MPQSFDGKVQGIVQEIRKVRLDKQYSQEYVAAKLNISQKTYSKIELGITELSLVRFLNVAAILEVDIIEFWLADVQPVK